MKFRKCRICKKEIEAHTSDESYDCLMEMIESFCDLYNHEWVWYNFKNPNYLDNPEDIC